MVNKQNNNGKSIIFILIMFVLILNTVLVLAQPPLPLEIYGSGRMFNTPFPPGTLVNAIDIRGNSCGEFKVTNQGFFGTLSCMGKNTSEEISGAAQGEIIRFRVGNFPATTLLNGTAETIGNLIWDSGEFKKVILVVPPLVCGDGFCDFYETCNTCPEDCGECPIGDPEESGESGESGDVDSMPAFPDDFLRPERETLSPEEECRESWDCSEWSLCTPRGIQTRECVDINDCGTDEDKPETERECEYEEFEMPPPLEDTDIERPRTEMPMTIEKCDARLQVLGSESLVFFLLFAIIILGPLFYLHYYKKKVTKKKFKEIDKLVLIYKFEHKVYTYLIIILVLSIIVYLYHFFFFLCPEVYYNNLWLLLAFVLFSPIIINIFIRILKYSEKRKILLIKMLQDTHYKHLKYLITLFNKDLLKSEVEITNKIYALNNKDEFSDVLANVKEIKKIYDDLLKLYALYVEEKDSLKIEKDLLIQIETLDKNKEFNEAIQDYPELASLKDNISMLYGAYESKKELTNKLEELEESYKKEEENTGTQTEEEVSKKNVEEKETNQNDDYLVKNDDLGPDSKKSEQ